MTLKLLNAYYVQLSKLDLDDKIEASVTLILECPIL